MAGWTTRTFASGIPSAEAIVVRTMWGLVEVRHCRQRLERRSGGHEGGRVLSDVTIHSHHCRVWGADVAHPVVRQRSLANGADVPDVVGEGVHLGEVLRGEHRNHAVGGHSV